MNLVCYKDALNQALIDPDGWVCTAGNERRKNNYSPEFYTHNNGISIIKIATKYHIDFYCMNVPIQKIAIVGMQAEMINNFERLLLFTVRKLGNNAFGFDEFKKILRLRYALDSLERRMFLDACVRGGVLNDHPQASGIWSFNVLGTAVGSVKISTDVAPSAKNKKIVRKPLFKILAKSFSVGGYFSAVNTSPNEDFEGSSRCILINMNISAHQCLNDIEVFQAFVQQINNKKGKYYDYCSALA